MGVNQASLTNVIMNVGIAVNIKPKWSEFQMAQELFLRALHQGRHEAELSG